MDDDDLIIIVVIACVAAVHQLITAYSILFDDLPTARRKGWRKSVSVRLHPTNEMFLLDIVPQSVS
jgi:hypothetical protein